MVKRTAKLGRIVVVICRESYDCVSISFFLHAVAGAHPQNYQQFMAILCDFMVERQRELQGEHLSLSIEATLPGPNPHASLNIAPLSLYWGHSTRS